MMPPAGARRPSSAQSQGLALRLPGNEMLRLALPQPVSSVGDMVPQGPLRGVPRSGPGKYHQATASALPASED